MMEDFLEDYAGVLVLGTLAVLILLWLGWRIRIAWKNLLFSLIRRRGRLGEDKAIELLKNNGYKIIQSQVPLSGTFQIDNQPANFNVRVDYLVEREGVMYMAEVKTGLAAQASNPATRRQLLEYAIIGKTDVIVLVDSTLGTVKKIGFTN
tara:strand:+ start:208 stop:657 length:450 start_codon:yes stop_codon:yes gene_type:complete